MRNSIKTHDEFVKEVMSLVGSDYEVIGKYHRAHTKILMKHSKCGNMYYVTPHKFLCGNRCPECARNKKKTTESFKQEIFDLTGDKYEVLGEYVNGSTEIKMKHNSCNNEFYVKPKNFLKTKRCPFCNPPKNKKNNTAGFKEKVYSMYKDEYKVLGEYINNSTKILMRHNICGNEYYVRPANVLRGNKCPECYGIKKKDTEIFKNKVFELVGDEYKVLSEYKNNSTKIKMKHNKCGHIYTVRPACFLKGARCPKCFGKNKKNTDIFKAEVFDLYKGEYTVLGEYKNADIKILVRHNPCGKEYEVRPSSLLRGHRCMECFGSKKKTLEQFKEEVFKLVGNDYNVLGEYVNADIKTLIKHNKCGHEYLVQPKKFLSGRRCPKCFGCFKKTTEQFKEELFSQVGDEYEVLGEYINANTKILVKHNACGNEYKVTPSGILGGRRCPKCFGCFKKTTEQFKEEVFSQVGNEYEVLGEYIQANDYILMKHNVCNHEYNVTPSAFINNKARCPKCAGGVARTPLEFKEIFNKKYGDEYSLLSEYKNSSTPVLVRHNVCGYEYRTCSGNLTKENPTKCPKCAGNLKKTTEQFKKEVFELVGDEYKVLSEYKNNETKILMIHNDCGNRYGVRPGSFLRGTRCPKCFGSFRKTTEQFKSEVFELTGNEYEVLGEYTNTATKIKMIHNECGNKYMVAPASFLGGSRCPFCRSSKGEIAIRDFLNKYHIDFEREFTFEDCVHINKLKFDFAIFKDGELILLIEFDGIQHFEPIRAFGGEDGFKETQIRDSIKNEYCKENKIPLIRIPYWNLEKVPKILGKKLYKLGVLEIN